MAEELQNIRSIFDFFYLDNPKIKSFYAQLTGNGALASLRNISHITDIRKLEGSVGVPGVANGKGATDHSAGQSSEHQYDATHTMPREMINQLDELGFIHKELNENQLGNLVLLEGKLKVVDVSVLKDIVKPAIEMYEKTLPNITPAHKKKKAEIDKKIKPALSLIQEIPYALESRLQVTSLDGKVLDVWMTLNRSEMVNSTLDINFKHGEFMFGQWYVLGILDALPDGDIPSTEEIHEDNDLGNVLIKTMQLLRKQFGRPETSFGLTPIAIFRVLRPSK